MYKRVSEFQPHTDLSTQVRQQTAVVEVCQKQSCQSALPLDVSEATPPLHHPSILPHSVFCLSIGACLTPSHTHAPTLSSLCSICHSASFLSSFSFCVTQDHDFYFFLLSLCFSFSISFRLHLVVIQYSQPLIWLLLSHSINFHSGTLSLSVCFSL